MLATLTPHDRALVTGRRFFPHLISAPFRAGLHEAFAFAIVACLIAAAASLLRGGIYHHEEHRSSRAAIGGRARGRVDVRLGRLAEVERNCMRVEWYGQSAFALTGEAATVFIDPFGDMTPLAGARASSGTTRRSTASRRTCCSSRTSTSTTTRSR